MPPSGMASPEPPVVQTVPWTYAAMDGSPLGLNRYEGADSIEAAAVAVSARESAADRLFEVEQQDAAAADRPRRTDSAKFLSSVEESPSQRSGAARLPEDRVMADSDVRQSADEVHAARPATPAGDSEKKPRTLIGHLLHKNRGTSVPRPQRTHCDYDEEL
ncbi:hypothetical protein STCU_12326 [Strigomonas culicis]|uniref:Uncharacterized protein n=1 Tax=Strigomonas culicis TaxID=28005 RepID=S9UKH5_9TRYP|nr:hypothetical protein STCU_12326 [Strigomonas culicis]|eukprot:EPY15136.1 hypothetical protein STCU_12326 [Strigomonas culicis]